MAGIIQILQGKALSIHHRAAFLCQLLQGLIASARVALWKATPATQHTKGLCFSSVPHGLTDAGCLWTCITAQLPLLSPMSFPATEADPRAILSKHPEY